MRIAGTTRGESDQTGRRKKRGAFTLIELLVVIAIIALLTGILLPSLHRAKGLAKSILCATNTRGIGTALSLYAEEWRDKHPLASSVGNWGADMSSPAMPFRSWMEQLYSYHQSMKLYLCPERPDDADYSYFLGTRAAFLETGGYFDSVNRNLVQFPTAHVLAGCTSYHFERTDCDRDDYTQDCLGFPVHNEREQTLLFHDIHVESCRGYVEGAMTFRYREMAPWWLPGDPS